MRAAPLNTPAVKEAAHVGGLDPISRELIATWPYANQSTMAAIANNATPIHIASLVPSLAVSGLR